MSLDYPEDVARLRAEIPELQAATPESTQALYREYSDQEWCAGWMGLSAEVVEHFRAWVNGKHPIACLHEHYVKMTARQLGLPIGFDIVQCRDCKLVGAQDGYNDPEWAS